MAVEAKECPKCRMLNPPETRMCICGYNFPKKISVIGKKENLLARCMKSPISIFFIFLMIILMIFFGIGYFKFILIHLFPFRR